jgi:hypothetical protein
MKTSFTQRLGKALREPEIFKNSPEKDRLTDFLIANQMGPFFFRHNLTDILTPAQHQLVHSQVMANEIFLHYLRAVEQKFKASEIPYVRIKGFSLLSQIGFQHRTMKDIDLLVLSPEKFPAAEKILKDLDYERAPLIRWEAADTRFDYFQKNPATGIEVHIDLHRQLYWQSTQTQWHTTHKNGDPILALEDQVFHLILNWLYQDGGVDFYKVYDLHLLLTANNDFSWPRLESLAEKDGLVHVVSLALAVIDEIFESSWSQNWPVPASVYAYGKKLVSEDYFIAPQKQGLKYFLLKHWVRSSWSQAFYYDFIWLRAYAIPKLKVFSRRAWPFQKT